jgi:YfiH family protein
MTYLFTHNKKITHRFLNKSWGIPRDNKKLKQEKLDEVARFLEIEPKNLVTLSQVHSSNYIIINAPLEDNIPEADALITCTPGLFLGVFTADCVPILLACEEAHVVAAVHAGWRGAVASIVENTIGAMQDLGARDISAALGPCIWQESYEVSQEFYDQRAEESAFFIKNKNSNSYYFDLPGYVTARLLKAGVKQVIPSGANTYSDHNFNSYRRTTHYPEYELQSNLSVIGIS